MDKKKPFLHEPNWTPIHDRRRSVEVREHADIARRRDGLGERRARVIGRLGRRASGLEEKLAEDRFGEEVDILVRDVPEVRDERGTVVEGKSLASGLGSGTRVETHHPAIM